MAISSSTSAFLLVASMAVLVAHSLASAMPPAAEEPEPEGNLVLPQQTARYARCALAFQKSCLLEFIKSSKSEDFTITKPCCVVTNNLAEECLQTLVGTFVKDVNNPAFNRVRKYCAAQAGSALPPV